MIYALPHSIQPLSALPESCRADTILIKAANELAITLQRSVSLKSAPEDISGSNHGTTALDKHNPD
jgi:hypothetical protein